jgi:hypothetical protein
MIPFIQLNFNIFLLFIGCCCYFFIMFHEVFMNVGMIFFIAVAQVMIF